MGPESMFWDLLEADGINVSPSKLLSLPVYEICEELIRSFGLDRQSDPYLQFFLDVIIEQSVKPEFDLADMILLWEQKKDKLSIVIPEGINAVNVMTIHKSKGLEFPVVIYPFAKELHKSHGEKLWVDFKDEAFSNLTTTLITTSKRIEETQFKEVYEIEKNKSLLDLINIMCVVLTRPTDQLYVITGKPPSGTGASFSVPFLLMEYLKSIDVWDETLLKYEFGSKTKNERIEKELSGNYSLEQFISTAWRDRIYLSLQAPDYWETENPIAKQDTGKLIHKIFSEINSEDEKDVVLEKYFQDGIIAIDEKKKLEKDINQLFLNAGIKALFRKGPLVKTESEILLPNGNTYRPDRINIDTDSTEVIDFKTGKESKTHHEQIRTYIGVLKEMGCINVKGYLLYIGETKVVEVV
jgi:ATP-dependent exoDNAse (exonuclease V) beta subunit